MSDFLMAFGAGCLFGFVFGLMVGEAREHDRWTRSFSSPARAEYGAARIAARNSSKVPYLRRIK